MKLQTLTIVFVGLLAIVCNGCEKFLAEPSRSNLLIPATLEDCQRLLDDYGTMNTGFPSDGEASADDYHLETASWAALPLNAQHTYIWYTGADHDLSQWSGPYKTVYNANLVLSVLEGMEISGKPNAWLDQYSALQGAALFYRAYAFYELAQLFMPVYVKDGHNSAPGIPLKLTPNIEELISRATVGEVYTQIVNDYTASLDLLPSTSSIASRPSKIAAYGALARTYLTMGEYEKALQMADRCLSLYSRLMDYNTYDPVSTTPFTRFNEEVIFHATTSTGTQFAPNRALVAVELVGMYGPGDLRLPLFFNNDGNGNYNFKGSYDGTYSQVLFTGLTTGEQFLIKAECLARAGLDTEALTTLNTLLEMRFVDGNADTVLESQNDVLRIVLNERRKELVFRGLRWSDLRRLNTDPKYAKLLERMVDGQLYTLPPNDSRYVLLIPQDVMIHSTITQNPR